MINPIRFFRSPALPKPAEVLRADLVALLPADLKLQILQQRSFDCWETAIADVTQDKIPTSKAVNQLHLVSAYDVGDYQVSGLTEALRKDQPWVFNFLLKRPIHSLIQQKLINKTDAIGFAPLSTAIITDRVLAAKKLLKLGANPLGKDVTGKTPLDWAALGGQSELLGALISEAQIKKNPIAEEYKIELKALAINQERRIKRLVFIIDSEFPIISELQSGIKNAIRTDNLNQLMVSLKSADALKEPEIVNNYALAMASRFNKVALVPFLLARGADMNSGVPSYCAPPLHEATRKGHLEMAVQLIEAGADINAKGDALREGRPPLLEAAKQGNSPLVKAFLNHGADIEASDHLGHTALFEAADQGRLDTVNLLLRRGANKYRTDDRQLTAWDWASREGHSDVAWALTTRGCMVRVLKDLFLNEG